MLIAGNKDTVTLEVNCPFCLKRTRLEVSTEGYSKYMWDVPVQEAFPELSATDREVLLTGMCKDCQDMIFGEE